MCFKIFRIKSLEKSKNGMLFVYKAAVTNSDMFAWFYRTKYKIAEKHAYFVILFSL